MLDPFPVYPQQKQHEEPTINPVFWDKLSAEDKAEFNSLKNQFHQNFNSYGKDRRVVTFANELMSVLKFIDRDSMHREERSILTGVCFAGPLICVNTRQLKTFLGRCKSSINGSLQQMGYIALRTKAKARNCIISILKPLSNEPSILRQWTVRCASENTEFCYLSSFSTASLPEITDADLYEEKSTQSKSPPNAITKSNSYGMSMVAKIAQETRQVPKMMPVMKQNTVPHKGQNLPSAQSVQNVHGQQNTQNVVPERKSVSFSYSIDKISFEDDWVLMPLVTEEELDNSESRIPRSASAGLDITGDWMGYIGDIL